MAQAQPTRGGDQAYYADQEQQQQQLAGADAAIQYGHVFAVTGDLAVQPIAPRDAAAMRSAEDSVPGVPVPQNSGGGFSAAITMETAAAYNEGVGAVRLGQASESAAKQGMTITQTAMPGGRIVTEFVAGQVVGQYCVADQPPMEQVVQDQEDDGMSKVTIGEALEAAALSAEDRPVDRADAEAISAAETQAHGAPGGLADQAQAEARTNASARSDDDKVKIGDVLSDATTKVADDRAVGMEDAARVVQAETAGSARAKDGGVGATVVTAARLNHEGEDTDDDAI